MERKREIKKKIQEEIMYSGRVSEFNFNFEQIFSLLKELREENYIVAYYLSKIREEIEGEMPINRSS